MTTTYHSGYTGDYSMSNLVSIPYQVRIVERYHYGNNGEELSHDKTVYPDGDSLRTQSEYILVYGILDVLLQTDCSPFIVLMDSAI